jgi:micrococcal nuclease
VIDGDTIECRAVGRIRLIGIDSPEGDQHPFGEAASDALTALLRQEGTLRLEPDAELRDRYGRLLAYLWRDQQMLNWQMVRMGWAAPLRFVPNVRYAETLAAASRQAQAERKGLWAVGGFDCLPALHRRRQC